MKCPHDGSVQGTVMPLAAGRTGVQFPKLPPAQEMNKMIRSIYDILTAKNETEKKLRENMFFLLPNQLEVFSYENNLD